MMEIRLCKREKIWNILQHVNHGTSSIEEIEHFGGPKLFQLYIHKDQGLTDNLINRCGSGFDAMCRTADTVVAGNREGT